MIANLNNSFQIMQSIKLVEYVIFITKTTSETKIRKKVQSKKVELFFSEAPWDPEAWNVLYSVCHHKHFQTFQQ